MIYLGAAVAPLVLPITLVNGTIADADQVMADFVAISDYINANTNEIHQSGGTEAAQTLTYSVTPSALVAGDGFAFIVGAGRTNSGASTLNVNGTGAKFLTINNAPLTGGELVPGNLVVAIYDGASYQIIGGAGGTVSGSVTSPNLLINPSMLIDQANEGAVVTPGGGTPSYVVDGWLAAFASATATVTAIRSADAPPGFPGSLLVTVTAGAAVAANDYLRVYQPIEAFTTIPAAFGSASARKLALSFWVKSSIGNYVMSGVVLNAAGNRSYPFNVTITSGATWEKKTVIIPGDITGTWPTTGNGISMSLHLVAAVGSASQGPANTWAAANYWGTSANTNTILSTTNATFQVTGVDLRVSPVPLPFVARSYADEFAACMRYYEKSYAVGTVVGSAPGAGACTITIDGAASTVGQFVTFSIRKRAAPSLTIFDGAGTSGKVSFFGVAVWQDGGAIGAASFAEMGFWVESTTPAVAIINYEFTADARL